MVEENVTKTLKDLGFGGAEPAPTVGTVFSDLAVKAAQKEVERKSSEEYGWWDLVGTRYVDYGAFPSAYNVLTRPEAVYGEQINEESARSVFEGITDEKGTKRVAEALEEKGLKYAQAIANEVKSTQEANKLLASAGLRGASATLFADVMNPEDWGAALVAAGVTSAIAPAAAPITAPVAGVSTRAYKLFSKFKDNKKFLLAAAGIGGVETAGLEYLRSQTKYDITGGDIMLAGLLGMGTAAGVSKLGQVASRQVMVRQAMRKEADGEELTDLEALLLNRYTDDSMETQMRQDSELREDMIQFEDMQASGSGLTRKDFTEMSEDELAAIPKQLGGMEGVRGIVSSVVRGLNSDDDVARWLASGLGLNSTGNTDRSAVGFGSLEQRDMLVMISRLGTAEKIQDLRQTSNMNVDDLNKAVSRYIRQPDVNAPQVVKDLAKVYSDEIQRMGQLAVDANVAGFVPETIAKIKNYLPRRFHLENIETLRQTRLRDNPDGTLNEAWYELSEAAIRKGQPDLEASVKAELRRRKKKYDKGAVGAFIRRMSRGYINTVINPKYDQMTKLKMANGDFDAQDFAKMMREEKLDDGSNLFDNAEIDIMFDVLTRNVQVKGNPRSRPRMRLDEMTRLTVTDSDGVPFDIGFNDLLDENIETIFDGYVFQMGGAISLARNGMNTNQLGSDFETIFSKMTKATDSEKKAIRFMYESTTGQWAYTSRQFAGQEMSQTTARNLGRVRELGFMANMGMAGMAAIMEVSNALFEYSWPTLMKTVPQYAGLMRKAANGQLKNRQIREMMAGTGLGGDGLTSKVTSQKSRLEGDLSEGIRIDGQYNKLDEYLGKGRMFVAIASGLQGITDGLRQISMYNYASEWAYATQRGDTAFSNIKREQLGISDDVANNMRQMISEHAEFDTDGTLISLNVDRWGRQGTQGNQFVEAGELFFASARREATQAVQEVNAGSVNPLLRSEVGKSFFQFLSFPMASMEQQAMRQGVKAVHGDGGTVAKIMLSSLFLGSMMYTSRSYLNSMGRSDQEKYLEKRFQVHELLEGSLSQIGALSLFGYVYQVTTGTMDGNTYALTPAGFSLATGALKGGYDVIGGMFGGDVTENELRSFLRIFPFTSLYGARQVINALAATAD